MDVDTASQTALLFSAHDATGGGGATICSPTPVLHTWSSMLQGKPQWAPLRRVSSLSVAHCLLRFSLYSTRALAGLLPPQQPPHLKISLQFNPKLNLKITKLLEENRRKDLVSLSQTNISFILLLFLNISIISSIQQQIRILKRKKNDKMNFIKIKNFCSSKDTILKEKTNYRLSENICNLICDKFFLSKILENIQTSII